MALSSVGTTRPDCRRNRRQDAFARVATAWVLICACLLSGCANFPGKGQGLAGKGLKLPPPMLGLGAKRHNVPATPAWDAPNGLGNGSTPTYVANSAGSANLGNGMGSQVQAFDEGRSGAKRPIRAWLKKPLSWLPGRHRNDVPVAVETPVPLVARNGVRTPSPLTDPYPVTGLPISNGGSAYPPVWDPNTLALPASASASDPTFAGITPSPSSSASLSPTLGDLNAPNAAPASSPRTVAVLPRPMGSRANPSPVAEPPLPPSLEPYADAGNHDGPPRTVRGQGDEGRSVMRSPYTAPARRGNARESTPAITRVAGLSPNANSGSTGLRRNANAAPSDPASQPARHVPSRVAPPDAHPEPPLIPPNAPRENEPASPPPLSRSGSGSGADMVKDPLSQPVQVAASAPPMNRFPEAPPILLPPPEPAPAPAPAPVPASAPVTRTGAAPAAKTGRIGEAVSVGAPSPEALVGNAIQLLDAARNYRTVMVRQERIGEKLQKEETLMLSYRRHSIAMRMEWMEGSQKGREVLFSPNLFGGMMHIKMAKGSILPRMSLNPDSPMVANNSRHSIREAGFDGMLTKLKMQMDAFAKGDKTYGEIRYGGLVNLVDNRQAHALVRIAPNGDVWVVAFDSQSGWPALAEGKSRSGELLERYRFGPVRVNLPELESDREYDPAQRWAKGGGGLLRGLNAKPESDTQP